MQFLEIFLAWKSKAGGGLNVQANPSQAFFVLSHRIPSGIVSSGGSMK
jgi:hypothetical protein